MSNITREDIADIIGEDALFADGFDDALIGYVQRFSTLVALYDARKCIEILMSEGLTEEESLEHFEYNVLGSWVGDTTPAFAYLDGYF